MGLRHCPPETRHVVGAGDGACVILAASSRQFQASGPWGFYTVDEAARRHNACSDAETQDGDVAYARVPPSHPVRYRDGLLPGLLRERSINSTQDRLRPPWLSFCSSITHRD
jgi:hypothetical protein